ncbi:RCC2-like protein [Pseudoscourfieldia marina]
MASISPSPASSGGYLVYSGATDFSLIGRNAPPAGSKASKKGGASKKGAAAASPAVGGPGTPELRAFHRLGSFSAQKLSLVASGTAACHGILVNENGEAFAFGRNEAGQCGITPPCAQISTPFNLSKHYSALIGKKKVVAAACGKHHTVLVTEDGCAYACGSNKMGQCGLGGKVDTPKSQKAGADSEKPVELKQCDIQEEVVSVACGADFTMFVTKNGQLYACGSPQYGQLGNGTDGSFNSSASSIKMVFEPFPKPTRVYQGFGTEKVIGVACGHNHSIAITDAGHAYTWGFGGYGRLGHKEQKDEMTPRRLETFTNRFVLPDNGKSCRMACGQTFSLITAFGGQLYVFGKPKATGDNIMYPKPLMEISGWTMRSIACGATHTVACSEKSTIAWGSSQYGECAFGAGGPKSSANPKLVDDAEGLVANSCAAGTGLSMVLMNDPVDKFPLYEPPEDTPDVSAPTGAGAKRKTPASKAEPAQKKGKKAAK